jgi:hypothetical protein
MKAILKTEVEVIKYTGRNKKSIINRLNIKEKNTYFIIPFNEADWFILNEAQFKRKIEIGRK